MTTHASDEPPYKISRYVGHCEVRRYEPYTVAEIFVGGTANDAANTAFPILARYIFGNNKGKQKLAMTAPVTQFASPGGIPSAEPVMQAAAPGGYRVQFLLPRGTTQANAPEPSDPRVVVHDAPGFEVAVIRYSGLWTDANYRRHLAALQDALVKAHETWSGEPIYARYNAPFTPWFLRRNEIWLRVP